MKKKRIIIAGPIGDFGGRDIEVNIIASVLEAKYEVMVLSTIYMNDSSFALRNLQHTTWNSIPKILSEENKLIKNLSRISKFFNKGNIESYGYVINSFSKKMLDLDRLYLERIQKEILQSNLVILCVQLTTKFLPEIIAFCNQKKIPCLVRTTGTIRHIEEKDFDFLKKANLFIHHSEANAENLNNQIKLPYKVIDQCALTEKELLFLKTDKKEPLRFGYLGRLSEEKGILPVAEFFAKTDLTFVIAGDGSQKEQLLKIIKDKSNCRFIGLLKNENIGVFFNQIDVLIIPSYEESGPLVGLEAMAAGKIIISTKVGAMEERLDGLNSFWFQIEKLSTLELTISQVKFLSEYEKTRISNSLRKRYVNNYSLEAISEKYLLIINQYIKICELE